MKKLLCLAIPVLAVLAGCGTDTCTSSDAKIRDGIATSCALAPASGATVQVGICGRCNDSSPSCDAEFRNGTLDIGTAVQQCQASSDCSTSGCSAAVQTVTCAVKWTDTPAPGQYPIVIVGEQGLVNGTVSIGSGSSCQLL